MSPIRNLMRRLLNRRRARQSRGRAVDALLKLRRRQSPVSAKEIAEARDELRA